MLTESRAYQQNGYFCKMQFLRKLFDFYISGSIHVALAVYAFVRITQVFFPAAENGAVAWFAFFGTITGYNFVKYDALARTRKGPINRQVKAIAMLSFFSFAVAVWFFFSLQPVTQLIGLGFLLLTVLYTLPFFPNRTNARNWAGVKIYMVALCWVGVTLVLPVINAQIGLTSDFFLKCVQRFILVFVLILIFEIVDLKYDDPHLKTVPQQIGVGKTKFLGYLLLMVFCLLEIFRVATNDNIVWYDFELPVQVVVAILTALFLFFASPHKPRYYSAFWVEAIPVFCWGLLVLVGDN